MAVIRPFIDSFISFPNGFTLIKFATSFIPSTLAFSTKKPFISVNDRSFVDPFVDGFMARESVVFIESRYLLRGPCFFDSLFDDLDHFQRKLDDAMSLGDPRGIELLGKAGTVFGPVEEHAFARVPPDFPGDRARGPSELPGDLAYRDALGEKVFNRDPLLYGKM